MVEVLQKIDTPSVEQVIAVPMISLDRIPQRSAVCRPQKAEQLVEVPTVLSYALLQQRIAEQSIDIPVPHRRRGQGGLQGFPQDRIQQHGLWSGTLMFLFPEVACMFSGGSSSSAVSRGKNFFGLFPESKVRSPLRVRVRWCPPGRAHGLQRLMRGGRPRTSTTRTSSTMALRLGRLGTISTSVTVGEDGHCFLPLFVPPWEFFQCSLRLGAARVQVHGLVDSVRDGVLRDTRR